MTTAEQEPKTAAEQDEGIEQVEGDEIVTPGVTEMANTFKKLLKEIPDKNKPSQQPQVESKQESAPPSPPPPVVVPKPEQAVTLPTPSQASPADTDEIPASIRSEAGKASWNKLKADFADKEKRYKSDLDRLNRELAQAKTASAPSQELDQIRQERDQLRRQLEQADLLTSEEFGGYFQKELESKLRLAKKLVGSKHADAVIQVLQSGGSLDQLKELAEPLGEQTMGRLTVIMNDIDALRLEKEDQLAKHEESYAKLKTMREKKQREDAAVHQAQVEAAIQNAVSDARKLQAFIPVEGDDDHNRAVKEREEFVQAVLRGRVADDQVALVPVWAAQGLWYHTKHIPALTAEIDALKKQVKALSNAQPTSRATEDGGQASGDEELTFGARVKELLGQR